VGGATLLYVGISPKEPPLNGRCQVAKPCALGCGRTIAAMRRVPRLRLTLGTLLSDEPGIILRRVGSGGRYTFTNPGECVLDNWLARNAFVTWVATEKPWEEERRVLESGLALPLNIHGNPRAHLTNTLSAARSAAKRRANELPIASDSGGPRSAISNPVE